MTQQLTITSYNYNDLRRGIYTGKLRSFFNRNSSLLGFIDDVEDSIGDIFDQLKNYKGLDLCDDKQVYDYMVANNIKCLELAVYHNKSLEMNNGFKFILNGTYSVDLNEYDQDNEQFSTVDLTFDSITIDVDDEEDLEDYKSK